MVRHGRLGIAYALLDFDEAFEILRQSMRLTERTLESNDTMGAKGEYRASAGKYRTVYVGGNHRYHRKRIQSVGF